MILVIDTSLRNKIILGLFDRKTLRSFEFETENQSDDLLVAIEGVLKNNHLDNKDLEAIFVNLGPGSFTGLRVGITTANTLAWGLDIPIYGYSNNLDKLLARRISKNFVHPLVPKYE